MPTATLDDLLDKQREMSAIAEQLNGETNTRRIEQIAATLQGMADELQAMAETIASEATLATADNWTEVVLTEAQRQRVAEATSIHLESIRISDPGGGMTRAMPHTDPRIIEHHAMQEARRRKTAAESEALVREQLDESIAVIERSGMPAALDQLERLKADPKFLGGLLKKP